MGILDQVTEMRQQGLSEAEMTMKLQEQGVSPKAINDAFNQEKIKSAVSAEDNSMQAQNPEQSFYKPSTQEQPGDPYQNMPQEQPQVPGLPGDPASYQDPYAAQGQAQYAQQPGDPYAQQPVDPYAQQAPYAQDPYAQQPGQQEEYYPDQGYPQDPYAQQGQDPYAQDQYYPSQSPQYNTDTIIEISEQVFSEKMKKIEKQVEQFTEFASLAQTKIANNNERVKRMESIMDKLQITILEKIGSYGKDIGSIKKEMEMIEDSFTKVIPELKKKKSHSGHKTHKKTSHKK
jgi:hypothetical protein